MHRTAVAALIAMQLAAQQGNWEKVRGLQPGQQITVVTQKRDVVNARFGNWSAEALGVTRGHRSQSFALPDIRTVQVREKGSRWKSAMWGAVIGFVPVFVCGASNAGFITDQNNPRMTTRIGVGAVAGMFGAGIGAGIGALFRGSKYVTIYDSQRVIR